MHVVILGGGGGGGGEGGGSFIVLSEKNLKWFYSNKDITKHTPNKLTVLIFETRPVNILSRSQMVLNGSQWFAKNMSIQISHQV